MSISLLQAALSLSAFSPSISKFLSGSKVEAVSNKILEIAKTVTNAKNEFEAVEKIKIDNEMATAFQKAISESEKEIELSIIKDRENARNRDIAFVNSGRRNKRADIMVISAAMGLIICLLSIIFFQEKLPGEAVGIISTVAGIFGSCLKDAFNFEFGSSRGSKEKDITVASFLNKYN